MKNKFILELKSRGYLNQCTDLDKLDQICSKQSIKGYIGFDCTAKKFACRQSFANNDFEIDAKMWASSNCSTGRWHNINW